MFSFHTASKILFVMIAFLILFCSISHACTTLLAGRLATGDDSVLMSSSCDGDIMGVIYTMPAKVFPEGTKVPMYWNVPRPATYDEYLEDRREGYEHVGELPVEEHYRTILLGGNLESMTTGGMNEFGLAIAIEYMPMREGLACPNGVVGPNSNHWTTSLIANALLRTQTAREAIRLIGDMVEHYGFLYYRAPQAGVALPIADEKEAWLMEIFGPGEEWTPGSGKPGGVWCAQRIPDGEVGCNANRSRIGEVDLSNQDKFLASPNIYSLAEELGFWRKGEPFVWYEVYGGPGSRYNSLREWRALSLLAPSLDLEFTGDPQEDRYPFSIKPDKPVTVQKLTEAMRDGYEGTPFDLTEYPAFNPEGEMSSLARPWGPPELFNLLGIEPERAINTPSSGYVIVAQLRERLPDAVGNCMWFAYGPASTSCFTPIYAGVTDLPESWDHPADFIKINREQAQWNFRLVHNLVNRLNYQESIEDIQNVIYPAEERFFKFQPILEKEAMRIFDESGEERVESFVTEYAKYCLTQVEYAYDELVDYLLYRYLFEHSEIAPPNLPIIAPPIVPNVQ